MRIERGGARWGDVFERADTPGCDLLVSPPPPPSLHFNVLMQPKSMKHSVLSTYTDTHRVVLTMYVVWKSSLRETGS